MYPLTEATRRASLGCFRNNLRSFFSFCKHFTEQFQCIEGLEGLAQAVNMGSVCSPGSRTQRFQRKDYYGGAAGQENLLGELGFVLGFKEKPKSWLGGGGQGMILEPEKRFWLMFVENLIETTFVLVLRKQTVM